MKIIKQLIILIIIFNGYFVFNPASVCAADVQFTPQIPIEGVTGGKVDGLSIANYIIGITKYTTGIIMILAVVVMMYGGVRWITAMGNAEAISEAKKWIISSLIGLVISLCSFLLLATISPQLTQFKSLDVEKVNQTGSNGLFQGGKSATGTTGSY